jgi:hypothetical protein
VEPEENKLGAPEQYEKGPHRNAYVQEYHESIPPYTDKIIGRVACACRPWNFANGMLLLYNLSSDNTTLPGFIKSCGAMGRLNPKKINASS